MLSPGNASKAFMSMKLGNAGSSMASLQRKTVAPIRGNGVNSNPKRVE